MYHLELSPIPGITISRVTYFLGKDDKGTKFNGFFIKLDVDYRDVLGTEETSNMPETPGFNYTAKIVCHGTICITVTLLLYWEHNGSEILTTINKIKYQRAVVNAIDNAVNEYYQRRGGGL